MIVAHFAKNVNGELNFCQLATTGCVLAVIGATKAKGAVNLALSLNFQVQEIQLVFLNQPFTSKAKVSIIANYNVV